MRSGFIGAVGDDEFGSLVVSRLKNGGVDTSHVKINKAYTTGTAFVMYYSSRARKSIYHLRHSAAGQLRPRDVSRALISKASLLHIMGSGLAVSDSSRDACVRAVRLARDRSIVIKLGEEGAVAVTIDRVIRQPAFKVKEVGPTGAGDVFDGAFVVGLLSGWKLERTLRFACAAGAIKVTREGPMEGPASRAEIQEFIARSDR